VIVTKVCDVCCRLNKLCVCVLFIQAQRQLDWLGSIQRKLSPGTAATLQDVRLLIETGLGLGKLHSSCERAVGELRKLISTCQHYELKAARLLSNKFVHYLYFSGFFSSFFNFLLQLLWLLVNGNETDSSDGE